jgi:hypothetical protein
MTATITVFPKQGATITRPCPHCHAAPWQPCGYTLAGRWWPLTKRRYHPSREAHAEAG